MNMDDGDYQLLVCALQQNFAEAGEVVTDGAGWLLQFVNYAVQCTTHCTTPYHTTLHHTTPDYTTAQRIVVHYSMHYIFRCVG